MSNLKTEYLGLQLRNPVVVSSSALTASIDKLKRLEESGAGAVVLKSLFEEQIHNESAHLESFSAYTEAADYLGFYLKEEYLHNYLQLIADAKKELSIPVIASLNCVSNGEWIEFAKRIEQAGADAIELNIFMLITNRAERSEEIEQRYLSIVQSVTGAVKIPVSVKISPRFTNLLGIIEGIKSRGAKGVVLFNRFYEPDINVNSLTLTEADIFSTSSEIRNGLRWVGMTSANIPHLDIAASTGVHTGEDAVKMMLAGASAVQVCSVIYREGLESINAITSYMTKWMKEHHFDTTPQFIGKLNYSKVENPLAYERAQFMKHFSSHE